MGEGGGAKPGGETNLWGRMSIVLNKNSIIFAFSGAGVSDLASSRGEIPQISLD